jgi:hypothetical protein
MSEMYKIDMVPIGKYSCRYLGLAIQDAVADICNCGSHRES